MINKKRIWQSLLVFFGFAFFVFMLNITSQSLHYDIIWCFHISQKVANGFELYSEIGTVVTPIYFWLGSLFIKIFGNSLISMDIYSGFVSGMIAMLVFNIIQETKHKENVYANLLFTFYMIIALSLLCLTNYNTCAIMWVLFAAFLEVRKERKIALEVPTFTKKKENLYNLLIGLVLGLAFFTKQNIGTYGVLATGIFSLVYKCFIKKENTIKEILLKASGFLIILTSFVLYFVLNGTFADFINFCIGGLLEFGDKNLMVGMPYAYFGVITIITICFALIGSKKENNIVWIAEIIYLMCMMLLIYPLTNQYHIQCAMLMIVPIYMILLDKVIEHKNMYNICAALFAMFALLASITTGGEFTETELIYGFVPSVMDTVLKIFCVTFIMVLSLSFVVNEKALPWSVILVGAICFTCVGIREVKNHVAQENVPEVLSIYKYHGYRQEAIDYMEDIIEYILMLEASGEKVYVVSADASYYMAALGRNQYKYDLNLYGSLGYKGEDVLIEETGALGDVIIMKDKTVTIQEPKKFDEFIKENYEAFDEVGNLIVYRTRD
ncbi:MAG: hypothetical protein IKJ32_00880 [Clostridia bacterium]|nr:hypothetical protein [Clostridia bacterium]